MLKQNQNYGCGMYAVANALNLPGFATPERLEKSKNGNRNGQLSKWLQEDGNNFYIEVLYFDWNNKKLPETIFGYKATGENVLFIPLLFEVKYTENGLQHMVAGKIDKDGKLYILDSLRPEIIETTLRGMNEIFECVFGMYHFAGVDCGEYVSISYPE